MSKFLIVIVIVVALIVAAGYYFMNSKGPKSATPANYTSNSSAQPSPEGQQSLEQQANSIDLAVDDTSSEDLTALDADIKGL